MKTGPEVSFADRLDRLVDWLYPPRCRFCKELLSGPDDDCFCPACLRRIRLVSQPMCTICGRPFLDAGTEDHLCAACMVRTPDFLRARAWACYPRDEIEEHPLREVVHRFKYGGKVSLARPLGRAMARSCYEFFHDLTIDAIAAVPLHPRRLRWRGFNQSVLLAKQISRMYDIPLDLFTLYRSVETSPQTQLSEDERRRNVRGVFALAAGKSVKGKNLLLVDDVYTSGATVNECSRVLMRGGAKGVYVLTLARTVS